MRKKVRRQKWFFDEYGLDYHEPDYLGSIKQGVFYFMIDNLLEEIEDQFNQKNLDIMSDAKIFSHKNLMENDSPIRADHLCKNYNLDPEAVETELKEFQQIYKVIESNIDLSDLYKEEKEKKDTSRKDDQDRTDNSEDEEMQRDEYDAVTIATFIRKGFMKPFVYSFNYRILTSVIFLFYIRF